MKQIPPTHASIMHNRQQPSLALPCAVAPHAQFAVHHAQTAELIVPLIILFQFSEFYQI
jgi:hypothetical protein